MVASDQVLITGKQLDTLCVNTIRTLAIDAVQQANSGHPGAPMGLAPVTYALWQQFLRYDPADPTWLNRDRFVLSNGHASMLLYAMLHLAEVRQVDENGNLTKSLSVSMDDIKHFRQLGSRTPGHPESHITTGVEVTTGPLGQGVGNSVGMAIAGKWQAANFNKPGLEIFNYNVYTMCSDGDLMEGIGGEAASLAGHLKLSNLCWIYDHNSITLDGPANWSFSEDVATRFVGYGWNITRVADANDLEMIARAFEIFQKTTDRPTLIIVDSHIGYGSPTNRIPTPPTVNLWVKRKCGSSRNFMAGRRMPSSWSRMACASISATPSGSAAANCARNGRNCFLTTRKNFPNCPSA